MHVMLQNRGTTPLPIGSPDAGGLEGLLPPGLEMPFGRDDIETLIFGEQPEPAGRSKLDALAIDPASPVAVEYGTDIDHWKGRSDATAETATMDVVLFVKNVGRADVVVTTSTGDITLTPSAGAVIETVAGLKMVGQPYVPPEPPVSGDVQITGFTAELDPVATAVDASMLDDGDTVTLTAIAGTPEAMALIEGHVGTVYSLSGNTFRISMLDLTGVDVTDLAATAAVTPVLDFTGTITAFTAANPTEVTMDAEDEALLNLGGVITLEALTGDPAAMAAIAGVSATVLTKAPVTLEVDLSAYDVTGLTADFVVS
jgi:hypothetical protein